MITNMVGCLTQGVYGWRLDPNVKSYRSYDKWEAPPDPEAFQVPPFSANFLQK